MEPPDIDTEASIEDLAATISVGHPKLLILMLLFTEVDAAAVDPLSNLVLDDVEESHQVRRAT